MADSHEGFFRSLRRTSVTDRRHGRAIGHVAHDLVLHAADACLFSAHNVPLIPASSLDADITDGLKAAVMSNAGPPEAGDAIMMFPSKIVADPERHRPADRRVGAGAP